MAAVSYHTARPVQVKRLENNGRVYYPPRLDSLSLDAFPSPPSSRSSPSNSNYTTASSSSPTSTVTSNTSHGTTRSSNDESWFVDDSKPASPDFEHNEHNFRDSAMTYDSCQFDADDWFAQFRGDIDISDTPPAHSSVERAGNVPVFDSAGNSRPFKSLFSIGEAVGDRQLIIFIRHFFCGVSLTI